MYYLPKSTTMRQENKPGIWLQSYYTPVAFPKPEIEASPSSRDSVVSHLSVPGSKLTDTLSEYSLMFYDYKTEHFNFS